MFFIYIRFILNIQELFTAFNNFAQKFIVDKNLKGKLNSTISFYAQWDSMLRFLPKTLEASGKLEITDGQLVQFEPMLKLSKYINDNVRNLTIAFEKASSKNKKIDTNSLTFKEFISLDNNLNTTLEIKNRTMF